MNEPNQLPGQATQNTPPIQVEPQGLTTKVWEKTPEKIKNLLIKFYANKKIFWLITGIIGLLLLVTIIGLIFGNGRQPESNIAVPTPKIETAPTEAPTDTISVTRNKLNQLKDIIFTLDLRQSTLKAPTIDYNIRF